MVTAFQIQAQAALELRRRQEQIEQVSSEPAKPSMGLFEFFCEAWDVLEPGSELLKNWHQELICEWLEKVSVGEVTRLILNIPPRYSKSLLATVCYPCWEWTFKPETRWIFASYSGDLSKDHSLSRRFLIQSEWYQERWGDVFSMAADNNLKTQFSNNRRGAMVATSLGGTVTGKGGKLVIDDPLNPGQAQSDVMREAANRAFDLTLSTRLNDKKKDPIVLIMQRLSQGDFTDHLLAKGGYTHVKIPAIATKEERIIFPLSGKEIHRMPGDLLHPEREGDTEMTQRQMELGSYAFAGQYQQEPAPTGGGLFKITNWMIYTKLPAITRWLLSVDATFKATATSDFVSINVLAQQAGIAKAVNSEGKEVLLNNYYVPAIWHERAGITDTQNAILDMRRRFPQAGKILIEDKANGSAIIEQLGRVVTGITPFNPGGESKTSRAWSIQPIHERGGLFLPAATWAIPQIEALGKTEISLAEYWDLYPPAHQTSAEYAPLPDWAKGIVDEFSTFPNGSHDDQVDSIDSGIIWCEAHPVASWGTSEAVFG